MGFPESGMSLPIKVGRIDIPAVLQETASQLSQKGRVGFYCGGVSPVLVRGKQCIGRQQQGADSTCPRIMCKIIIHKVVQRTMHRMTMCKIIMYKVVQR